MPDNQIAIRCFSPDDIPEILALLAKSFPDYWAPLIRNGLDHLQYGNTPFVATGGSRIVGTFGMKKLPVSLNGIQSLTAGICSVAVDPEYRGLGIATKLSSFALDYCRNENIGTSILFTDKPAVYEKSGWRICPWRKPLRIMKKNRTDRIGTGIIHGIPSDFELELLQNIYRNGSPDFNGKIIRSREYWENIVFNNLQKNAVCLLTEKAYALLYCKNDSCNLIEMFSLSDDIAVFGKLFDNVLDFAKGDINVSLPEKHPLMSLVNSYDSGITYDLYGEEFMINVLNPSLAGVSDDFYIAYADKF